MATEEEKKKAQEQRDAIQVTTDAKEEPEKAEAAEVETKEEETSEITEVEETKEEIEASEDKVEELEEELEDKALTAKEREKLEARIEKERKKNRDLRKDLEEANKQLAARPDDQKVFTEEEIVKRAKEMAKEEVTAREFEAAVNRIAKEAQKLDKDYQAKVKAMSEDYNQGIIPGLMIGILDDLPNNGGDVLMYLANHEDEYEEIHVLSPAKMALRLKDISDKLKPKAKKVSQVPAPNEGVKGKGSSPDVLRDDAPMEDWVRIRAKQVEERRKAKMGLH